MVFIYTLAEIDTPGASLCAHVLRPTRVPPTSAFKYSSTMHWALRVRLDNITFRSTRGF